jgi:hypothetical protein
MGAQRLGEAEIIESGWPQVTYDPAHIRHGGLGLVARSIQQLVDLAAGAVTGGFDRERDPRQGGSEPVMEIAPNAATLLLARVDDPLARVLELGCESERVERRRDLADEEVDEREVVGGVELAGLPSAYKQAANGLSPIAQVALEDRLDQVTAVASGGQAKRRRGLDGNGACADCLGECACESRQRG